MSARTWSRKSEPERKIGNCIQCKHAYDPHSPSLRGEPTLVRCTFNEWSQLANFQGCKDHFEWKEGITTKDPTPCAETEGAFRKETRSMETEDAL